MRSFVFVFLWGVAALTSGVANAGAPSILHLNALVHDDGAETLKGQSRISRVFGREIGVASGFNNDYLGDGEDRWQTASYFRSWLYDRPMDSSGIALGEILELRLRGQIITPQRLSGPTRAGERRYAGVLALAAFARRARGEWDTILGAELGVRGPISGMGALHTVLHDALAENEPKGWNSQLDNALFGGLIAEAGRTFTDARSQLMVRPFVAAHATDEGIVRVGADLSFGVNVLARRSTRDVVTGLRMPVRDGRGPRGIRAEIGTDVGYVAYSQLMPGRHSVSPARLRRRIRAALFFPAGPLDATFGLTFLGPEFKGQHVGQTIGTIGLNFRF